MARSRAYIGVKVGDGCTMREVFMVPSTPTEESHGQQYSYVVGPFHTKRDAISYIETQAYSWYPGDVGQFRRDEIGMLSTIFSNVLPDCPNCQMPLHMRRRKYNCSIMYCVNPQCECFDKSRPVVIS